MYAGRTRPWQLQTLRCTQLVWTSTDYVLTEVGMLGNVYGHLQTMFLTEVCMIGNVY